MEGINSKLSLNEIRCPYCRKKQQGLLEYYEELGLEKINGVNFYEPIIKHDISSYNYTSHKCEYQCPNVNYDLSKPESQTNSKYLNYQSCCHYNGTQILVYNKLNPSQPITYGDTKYYCYTHKKDMIKQYKLQQKEKEKDEKKQTKILKKQMKLLEKQKEVKEKAKELFNILNKNSMTENIVLGPLEFPLEYKGCVQILKTGLNKGNTCGCKIVLENMCKRHYLLKYKNLIINN